MQSVSELVDTFIKQNDLEEAILLRRIFEMWDKCISLKVKSAGTINKFRNKKLYLSVTSTVAQKELLLQKNTIMDLLNNALEQKLIEEIVIRSTK